MRNEIMIVVLSLLLGVIFGSMIGLGLNENKISDSMKEIQLNCLYKNRMQFGSEVFSCQYLPGVEEISVPRTRKDHPLTEVLK